VHFFFFFFSVCFSYSSSLPYFEIPLDFVCLIREGVGV